MKKLFAIALIATALVSCNEEAKTEETTAPTTEVTTPDTTAPVVTPDTTAPVATPDTTVKM